MIDAQMSVEQNSLDAGMGHKYCIYMSQISLDNSVIPFQNED